MTTISHITENVQLQLPLSQVTTTTNPITIKFSNQYINFFFSVGVLSEFSGGLGAY